MISPLYERIYKTIATIPHGQIASYSQVARAVGMPRGARIVGWALGAMPQGMQLPWQRVVNAKRQLTIRNPRLGPEDQRLLLEEEGRVITKRDEFYEVEGSDWCELQALPPLEVS